MKSEQYWAKRSALLMYDRMEGAGRVSAEVAELYRTACNQVTHSMKHIFSVYETKYGLDDKTAMRLLNSMIDPTDFEELKRQLIVAGTDEAKALLAELNSPAFAARIKRFQVLQEQIDTINQALYKNDMRLQKGWYTRLGYDTYYTSIYDVQRQVGFQFSFKHIDNELINAVMNSAWSNGSSFSDTLWKNVDGVSNEVRKQLTWGLITGKTEKQMAKEIANKYAVGSFASRRLVRTESCYLSNEIQFRAYEECGADRYQYVATLDSKTDEECGLLDRKIFNIKEKKPGVNCPPMHPFCRCTTKIYIDQNTRTDMKRRARDPKTGKNVIVSANLSYEQWAKQNGIKSKHKNR